jgi:DNA polymerase III delta prime subunit
MNDPKNFIWTEKYRPQTIVDTILPANIKATFQSFVDSGTLPHLLLCGSQGLGKTTVARAIASTLGYDVLIINGSDENGIDVLRNKIKTFASTFSFNGSLKVVILDEADGLTPQMQSALRNFMEEFAANCRFILTCNYKNKIISPIHSRCSVIEFNCDKKTLAELSALFMKRMLVILEKEGVKTVSKPALAELIMKYAPDWRRIIGECQRYTSSNLELSEDICLSLSDSNVAELVKHLKAKDFKSMRGWVASHAEGDPSTLFRHLYDNLYEYAEPSSIPGIILILADYAYKNAFVADRELNTVACFTEIMSNSSWK